MLPSAGSSMIFLIWKEFWIFGLNDWLCLFYFNRIWLTFEYSTYTFDMMLQSLVFFLGACDGDGILLFLSNRSSFADMKFFYGAIADLSAFPFSASRDQNRHVTVPFSRTNLAETRFESSQKMINLFL